MSSHKSLLEERVLTPKDATETPTPPTDEAALWSDLIELLEKIDTDAALAKLNETTIADINGQRVEL